MKLRKCVRPESREWAENLIILIFCSEKQKNRLFSFMYAFSDAQKPANLWRCVCVHITNAHSRLTPTKNLFLYIYIVLERKKKVRAEEIRRNWEPRNIVFVRILDGLSRISFFHFLLRSSSLLFLTTDPCCATRHSHATSTTSCNHLLAFSAFSSVPAAIRDAIALLFARSSWKAVLTGGVCVFVLP